MKRIKIILRLIWNREWHKIKWYGYWKNRPGTANYELGVDHALGNSADYNVSITFDRWTNKIIGWKRK